MPTHPTCGRSWSGAKREHCPACHETFNSGYAGDMHRTGDWTEASPRRCLTPDEMRGRGMGQTAEGYWISSADSREDHSPQTAEQDSVDV